MKFSKFNIIIPFYNLQLHVERSIRSAIKKRNLIPFFEIVVVNNGLINLTVDILKKFAVNNDTVLIEH